MSGYYEIIDASEWEKVLDEVLGSKRKVWLRKPGGEDQRWLFKANQSSQTGDDWAEKAAAELAALLGIPHARIELAESRGDRGCISLDFTGAGQAGELILGNEILANLDPDYPQTGKRNLKSHTIERVLQALRSETIKVPNEWLLPAEVPDPPSLFVGYLALDALVGNTDRHHENWGILRQTGGDKLEETLAPSYDHAASLGQILSNQERQARMNTRDQRYAIDAFALKARSAFYASSQSAHPLSTRDAFFQAAALYPVAGELWRTRLGALSETQIHQVFDQIPPSRIPSPARSFATKLVLINRKALVELPNPFAHESTENG